MGKRKERRLAAMSAAGRRVKLDLFAEPSGDSGGSSAQDELGGDIGPIHRAGSPNSPSSSGKQQENPLSLLGQYSDDELDDESSETLDHDTADKSTADDNEQAKAPVGTEKEDLENNAGIDHNPQNDQPHDLEKRSISVDGVQNLEHNVAREIDSPVTATGDLGKELVPMEETSVPGASNVQPIDNNISNWKVVLHEESNQYYYWNTVTGETSWVVPDVLVQGTDLSGEQKTASDADGRNIALAGEQEQKSSVDAELNSAVTMGASGYCKAGNVVCESEDIYEAMNETEEQIDRYKDKGLENNRQCPDANQTEVTISSGEASVLYHKTSSLQGNVSSLESSDPFLGNGTTAGADSEKNIWGQMIREEDDTENDLTSSVLKYSESLLDRLKSLKRNMQGHDWLSKYILEVEIRLSDIRSLLPFGSSLLPFWIHCERQLKELEGALDIEVSHYSKSAQTVEAELPHKSCESEGNEIEEDENEEGISSSAFDTSFASADVGMLKVGQNDLKDLAADSNAPFTARASVIDYPSSHSGSTAGKNNGVHEVAQNTELAPKAILDTGEDVDMDVDMEVEDSAPVSATITQDSLSEKCFAPQEQPIQPHPPAELGSFVTPEAFPVPPPPDEEWIPPPPPDNELIPPPPPDDPIEPSYLPPPSYSETVPAVSYTEPYNVSYPGSNFEYYGQANTHFLGNNAYLHAEGCQVAVPHPLYYEALAGTYPVAAPGVVNPVEPAVYYEVQNGAVLAGPVVSGAESSVQHSESGHDALGSDRIRSAESHIEEGYTSFADPGVGVPAVNGSTEKTPIEVSVAPATIQASSTISVGGNSSGSSTTTGAVAAKLAAPNTQPKVSRGKKRTVAVSSTLRSNKKVSSLVDKWKAAKEELHEEEEDEPENAYEILEKKRQREIEEWRAQQIASGEAKDNANFQPLGGDWRERVKRKRAQLNNEAAHTQSGAVTDGNQLPDLTELARDLPSGWQAYWDESSKQVYYGNVITSETTWTRPGPPK